MVRSRKVALAVASLALALPLAGCATGKAEVPEGVRRYTGYDDGCHTGGLGATTAANLVNKTLAGTTVGVGTSAWQGASSFDSPVANVLYAPVAVVGGVLTGITDGVGHVPGTQNCNHDFGRSVGYAWNRDYRGGTASAQVPEHRAAEWNGGSYWPGGPKR